jgi:hypothetical protein
MSLASKNKASIRRLPGGGSKVQGQKFKARSTNFAISGIFETSMLVGSISVGWQFGFHRERQKGSSQAEAGGQA